jgi:hypothetical protein
MLRFLPDGLSVYFAETIWPVTPLRHVLVAVTDLKGAAIRAAMHIDLLLVFLPIEA